MQRAVSRYVGGQLLFSTVMGTSTGLALYLFGVLGIFPDGRQIRGRVRGLLRRDGARPLHRPDPRRAAAGAGRAVHRPDHRRCGWRCCSSACSSSRATSSRPQIFGHTLRINPLLVIFALLLGLQVYGIVGALIALPILSVLRETVVYLNRHLTLEPWDRGPNGLL